MAGGFFTQSGSSGHRSHDMRLDRDRRRRGGGGGQLRIERGNDAVGAARRKARARVEQPKITRMVHMDDAGLHLPDCPGAKFLDRHAALEIEATQLHEKLGKVD